MSAAGPSRRWVLAAGGSLLAAGCLPGDGSPTRVTVSPEMRLRARIAGEVAALGAEYDAVMVRFPYARGLLGALATEHAAHAQALQWPTEAGSPTSSASQSPSPSSSASPSAAARAGTLREALRALAGAEVEASRRRGRQAGQAGPELARLLASISACEAVHAALLPQDPS